MWDKNLWVQEQMSRFGKRRCYHIQAAFFIYMNTLIAEMKAYIPLEMRKPLSALAK